jgi:hypothetical protein
MPASTTSTTTPSKPVNPSFDTQGAVKRPLQNAPGAIEVVQPQQSNKRSRKSAVETVNSVSDEVFEVKPSVKKPARKSEPIRRINRRFSALETAENEPTFADEKEMEYCRDLIKRMISGPGYWTRYVTNFKKPVDPVIDNAPNYFDVVKKPMCLQMMKTKMDNGEYSTSAEFEADIRLIFQNCYEYWTPSDPIWKECELFENFFNNQWAQRSKYYSGRRIKPEIVD